MTTKISPDDLLEAIESLKPAQDRITHSWYIGRREHTLQQVLTRATTADDPAAKKATPVRAPKHRGRTILAGAVAVAMLGGGAAWAYTTYASWYTAGALGGLTCMTAWAEPGDAAHADQQYGGPPLTTDPVADCDSYAETTGKRRIADPVAVRWRDWLVVGPRAGRPADAVPVTPSEDARVFELERSFDDYVDGGLSRCLDETTGTRFAHAELDRLGLTGWTVTTREQDPRSGPCALLLVQKPGVVEVRTFFSPNPAPAASGLIPRLRTQIAERCLSLTEAEAVVKKALAADHHWATASRVDPSAACTRVDLTITGSLQVFLYGPETAKR